MGIVGRRNPVVCGDDGAARRIVDPRKLVERDEALPVVAGIPPRLRHHAGASPAPFPVVVAVAVAVIAATVPPNWDAGGRDESDVPVDVGVGHVLLRRVEVPRGGDEAPPVPRMGQSEAGLQRAIVVPQRRPCECEHPCRVVARARLRPGIVEYRAVPRLAHVQHHVLVVPDPDALASDLELAPAVRGEVARWIRRVDPFDEQVLDVGSGVGEAPGGTGVVPEHDHRHAGHGRSDDVPPRPGEVREVPDRGCREPEVRIVREDRLAGRAPRTVDHPAIGAGVAAVGRERGE